MTASPPDGLSSDRYGSDRYGSDELGGEWRPRGRSAVPEVPVERDLVGELPDPVPAKGQALVRTHSCGLCASDLHFLKGGRNIIDLYGAYDILTAQVQLHRMYPGGPAVAFVDGRWADPETYRRTVMGCTRHSGRDPPG